MTSVYGPAASHERRVKGLEQLGEDIARRHGAQGRALVAQIVCGKKGETTRALCKPGTCLRPKGDG